MKGLLDKFLDVLYPPKCIACNQNVDMAHNFCQKCWGCIEFISQPSCEKCSMPLPVDYLGRRCYGCMELKPIFDESISIFRYDEFTKKLIHDLKFNDKTQLAKSFANLIYYQATELIARADLIVAVPMHKTSLRRRKYNHALLIAKNLGKIAGKEFKVDALVKSKASPSQIGLRRLERMKNLQNTFAVPLTTLVRGKVVVLVDDVMTTGATANECAKTLKKAGARRVYVVTVARAY